MGRCLVDSCNNPRKYVIGNERYFCKDHHILGSQYTRDELEKIEMERTDRRKTKYPEKDKFSLIIPNN